MQKLSKLCKGLVTIYACKILCISVAFLIQSCQQVDHLPPTHPHQASLLQFEKVAISTSQALDQQKVLDKGKAVRVSDAEVQRLMAPLLESSKQLLQSYGVVAQDIAQELSNADDPKIILVALAIFAQEKNEPTTAALHLNQLFGHQAFAQNVSIDKKPDMWTCAGKALGLNAVALVFARQVDATAILGAFRKVAARTLGWFGVVAAVYSFANCMGYI